MAVFRARGDEIPKGSRYLSEKSSFFLFFLSGPGAIQGETNRPSIWLNGQSKQYFMCQAFHKHRFGVEGGPKYQRMWHSPAGAAAR